MSKLGHPVVYRVLEAHKITVLEEIENAVEKFLGSVHHEGMTEFAGLVGRLNADGTASIVIFVPNGEAKWIDSVAEGTGPGTYALLVHEQAELQDIGGGVAEANAAAALAKNSADSAASSASSASSSASNAASSASSAGQSLQAVVAALAAAPKPDAGAGASPSAIPPAAA